MTPERELLREARDALYNAFEPDNQSAIYYKIVAFFALPATARSEPTDIDRSYALSLADAIENCRVTCKHEPSAFDLEQQGYEAIIGALRFFARSEMGDSGTAKVPEGIVLLPLRKEQLQSALRALGQIGIALPSPDGNSREGG